MVQKIPFIAWLSMLAELIDTGNLLDGAKLALYINAQTPADGSLLANFTPPTFTGSTPQSVVWQAVHSDPVDGPVVTGASMLFACSVDPAEAESIFGAILTNAAGDALLAACRFDSPVVISAAGQGVVVVPEYGPVGKWTIL